MSWETRLAMAVAGSEKVGVVAGRAGERLCPALSRKTFRRQLRSLSPMYHRCGQAVPPELPACSLTAARPENMRRRSRQVTARQSESEGSASSFRVSTRASRMPPAMVKRCRYWRLRLPSSPSRLPPPRWSQHQSVGAPSQVLLANIQRGVQKPSPPHQS